MNGGWWEELFSFKKSNFLSDLSAAGKIPHSKNQKRGHVCATGWHLLSTMADTFFYQGI